MVTAAEKAKGDEKNENDPNEEALGGTPARDERAAELAAKDSEKVETETVDLYNVNDGIYGRDGGPYLDQVDAAHWDKIHAAREGSGRKHDPAHPQPYAGIQLVPANVLAAGYNPTLIAGDDRRVGLGPESFQVTPMTQAEAPVSDTSEEGVDVILPLLKDEPEKNNASFAITGAVPTKK